MSKMHEGYYTKEEAMRYLASTEVMFQPFDRTYEAWLYRISLWGGGLEVKHYIDGVFKGYLNGEENIMRVIKSYPRKRGDWKMEKEYVNRVRMYRTWYDKNGRKHIEELKIRAKLPPEVSKPTIWHKIYNYLNRKLKLGLPEVGL